MNRPCLGEFKMTTNMHIEERDLVWQIKNYNFITSTLDEGGKLCFPFTVTSGCSSAISAKWELYLAFRHPDKSCKTFGLKLVEFSGKEGPVFAGFDIEIDPSYSNDREAFPENFNVCAEDYFGNGQYGGRHWNASNLHNKAGNINEFLINGSLHFKIKFYMSIHKIFNTFENSNLLQSASSCESAHAQAQKKVMEALFETRNGADVNFRTKEGKTITAHKIVLSAHSAVMKAMFTTEMKEGREGIVKLDDIGLPGLKIVLKFLYTGHLDDNWGQFCGEIVNAANKYQLLHLKNVCDKMLGSLCTKENCFELLKISELHGLATAEGNIQKFLLSDTSFLIRAAASSN